MATRKHSWNYENIGGATRVKVATGADIAHLGELDPKMWTVLSCPVTGLEIDEKSLKYIARVLLLSKDEALILSLFFEKSSSWRIRISDIAEMINTSNIRIISMINIADGLAKKGYLQESNSKEERYYTVPMEVIDSIRRNVCYIPKPLSNLTFDEFFDRLSNIFDDDDIALWRRENKLYDLVSANMHLPYCKVASSYELKNFDFILLHLFANRLINEDDDMIGTHDWEDIIDSKRAVRSASSAAKS